MYIDPDGHEPITFILLSILAMLFTVTILSLDTSSSEDKGVTIDGPSFMTSSNNFFSFISLSLSGGRKDWYLNKEKTRSFYFSGFNLVISLGIPLNSEEKYLVRKRRKKCHYFIILILHMAFIYNFQY